MFWCLMILWAWRNYKAASKREREAKDNDFT